MKSIKTPNYGPTWHQGGNSLANSGDLAWAQADKFVRTLAVGDEVDFSDADDLTIDEVKNLLRERGMRIVDGIVSVLE